MLAGTLVMLYCGNALTPAINASRDAGPAQSKRFDALHKRSVRLNGLALLIGLSLLVIFAVRRSPESGGIVERKPGELTPGQEKLLRDELAIEKAKKAILDGSVPPPVGIDPRVLPALPRLKP